MKLGIVSDHRGYKLKEELKKELERKGFLVLDFGTNSEERIDFPDYAFPFGEKIKEKEFDLGIAICGTGIGMSIALNKVKGVMCAKINNETDAIGAKGHNHANALAFSSELTGEEIIHFIDLFLTTEFNEDQSYERRINKILAYEERNES